MHGTCAPFTMQAPVRRQCRRYTVRTFDIDPRIWRQPASLFEASRDVLPQIATEWRVEKNQIVSLGRVRKPSHSIGIDYMHLVELEPIERRSKHLTQATITFDKHTFHCPARSCFDTERASPREQIQAARALDNRRQPVEQGFAYAIAGRTNARKIGHVNTAAAQAAADNTQLSGCRLIL